MKKDRLKSNSLTQGNIYKQLICFAVPLLMGNMFQEFYNVVDTWVVGNYVGNEAFSAVGSVTSIINMLIGFFMGFSSGAGVVISQYYGAGQRKRIEEAVHTAAVVTVILSVIVTALALVSIPLLLSLMKTPEDVWEYSRTYLTIYFIGLPALAVYNVGASILQASGDSKYPFLCLAACAVTNIVLDLTFVICFGMGIEGVAWATVIAEILSAAMVVWKILTTDAAIKLCVSKLGINTKRLKQILIVGMPTAVQLSVLAFSNIFIQSYINYFGADCMSAWTAYIKLDQLLLLPIKSISIAVSTFVGQNLGCMQYDRAHRGVRAGLIIAELCTIFLGIILWIGSPVFVGFFNSKTEVVEIGTLMLRTNIPFFIVDAASHIYSGALRGSGNGKVTLIIYMLTFVGCRQLYEFIVTNYIANTIQLVALGFPFGWLTSTIAFVIYYYVVGISKSMVEE